MIDIHTHTCYSDGSSTVQELLSEAQKLGITLLSITDHNTLDAYRELSDPNTRNLYKGSIIPGIEITTTYNGETIEVLGYGFDLNKLNKELKNKVLTFEKKQLKEFDLIKSQYRKIGVKFDPTEIKFDPKKESCRQAFVQEIKKYPENYKYFLYKESLETNSGFTRYEVYNPKSHLYVDESSLFPTLEETIEMIHDAEGIAFLAHPFAYSPNIANDLTNLIKNYNFDGIECYYTTFTEEQTNYLLKLCEDRNMFSSGGSDFHGTRKTNHNLGTGNNNLNIPEKLVEPWIKNYISTTKVTTSYYEPDIDGVASMYAYSEYLNKRNKKCDYFVYGKPKKEVEIISKMFNIPIKETNAIRINQDIIILDANDYKQFNFIKPKNVIEIIDHHKKVATEQQFPNAKIKIEQVGAAATLIAEKFKEHEIIPSRESAILLYYAIISNTINFNASSTTEKDKKMAEWLESLYDEISKDKIIEIFKAKSQIEEQNLRSEMEAEMVIDYNNEKMTIAQLEIVNVEEFLSKNKYKINQILETIKIEKNLNHIFINCLDIINGFNVIITAGENTNEILSKLLNITFENNTAKTTHLIQRKELVELLITHSEHDNI